MEERAERTDDAATPEAVDWTQVSTWTQLGPAGVLGVAWAVLPAVLGIALIVYLGPVSEWLEAHPDAGLALYVAGFAVTAGVGLLPTYAQAVLGGWVFGFALGLPAALLAFTVGAVLGWAIARLVARDRVRALIARDARAEAVRTSLVGTAHRRTLLVVTLLRVPPNSPFSLTNLALASTGVALVPYLVGTAVGMAPRTAVVLAFAAAARETGARDIQEFVSDGPGWWVFAGGIVLLVAVLSVLSRMARAALERVQAEGAGAARVGE